MQKYGPWYKKGNKSVQSTLVKSEIIPVAVEKVEWKVWCTNYCNGSKYSKNVNEPPWTRSWDGFSIGYYIVLYQQINIYFCVRYIILQYGRYVHEDDNTSHLFWPCHITQQFWTNYCYGTNMCTVAILLLVKSLISFV